MSWIWVGMLAISIFSAALRGNMGAVSEAMLSGAQAAITLALSLAGTICLWSGVAKLMEHSGVSALISRLLRPFLRRIYPQASKGQAFAPLCANVCANLLGLGNAATPLGIAAVQAMKRGERATDEMCRLIVMNTASIQLLPTTVAAIRAGLGCAKPFSILPAVWLTSVASVSVGLLMCFLLQKWVS